MEIEVLGWSLCSLQLWMGDLPTKIENVFRRAFTSVAQATIKLLFRNLSKKFIVDLLVIGKKTV